METFLILRRSMSTVSAVMTAYARVGKTGTEKYNSGWKKKLTDKGRRVLKFIVDRKVKQSLNDHIQNPFQPKLLKENSIKGTLKHLRWTDNS